MFNNLTYRKKSYLLLVIFICMLVITYRFAIKKTAECVQQYKQAIQSEATYTTYLMELNKLGKLNNSIDMNAVYGVKDNQDMRGMILESLLPYCSRYNATLINVSPTYSYLKEKYQIETIIVKFTGSFKDLLKLTYIMEKNKRIGKISSVNYYTDINRNNKRIELYAEFYIQNIKSKQE